ncbi:uncharacterized protein LY89DRAFT_685036 [Mollisia scopiformis]|uniref:BHLH domain-containing protein n=1 Tax=Mollisia scopiformis TaxID=149040 RepID=A0A194XA78_MOLSC|nr:uncharacterized protein LY89DRAFT_685036 [Mollisia scopiformis]KUJ17075.1 hypothetical protein LY89DRAFT_685036 [Mollisia scopiformis]
MFNNNTYITTGNQEYPYRPSLPSNLNFDLNFASEFQAPPDWLQPPPAWTPNRTPFTDADSLSGSGGAGVSYDSNWNPFDCSFSSINSTVNNGAFVSRNPFTPRISNPTHLQTGYTIPKDSSYVSLSSISPSTDIESPHFDYDFGRQDSTRNSVTRQTAHQSRTSFTSPLPSPGLAPQPQLQPRTRQPAWGHPRSRGTSSSTSSHSHSHSRRKSVDHKPRLRSTSSLSGTSTIHPKPENATKSNHNQIEKQYRNRLNSQFEVLLSALPKEENGDRDVEDRKVSKSEVLDLAQKHIRRLEREGEELEEENERLREDVEEYNRAWVEGGGVVMP